MTPHPAKGWLQLLTRAVAARQLYPAEHPRVVEAVGRLYELSLSLLESAPETSWFMIEGRLAWNGELVPDVDGVTMRAFELIQARGGDRVTLRRGLEERELEQLLGGLAGEDSAQETELIATAHIRFSVFDVKPTTETAPAPTSLEDIWRQVGDHQKLDLEALEGILAPIARLAGTSASEALPLSSLTHHDEYTATHVGNVAVLTMALAHRVGLAPAAVHEVGVAALLHDIGKMRIPADVLNEPGRLSPEQFALIRCHPATGARMLMQTPGVPQLAVIVAYEHHLQAEGGGYPDVPPGWRIHPASAMTHIADVYDALRTHRPYRGALTHKAIVETMLRDRGPVFPPALLDVFLDGIAPRTDGPVPKPVPTPPVAPREPREPAWNRRDT